MRSAPKLPDDFLNHDSAHRVRWPGSARVVGHISFYEDQQVDLGLRFEARVDATLQRIQADSTIFRFVTATVQKARIHKFPHSVYFVALPDIIGVLAIYDGRRDPDALRKRLTS